MCMKKKFHRLIVKVVILFWQTVSYQGSRPVTGTASKGAALFRKKVAAEVVYAPMVAETHEYQYNADAFETREASELIALV